MPAVGDQIRVSYGTAIVLGLKHARQDVPPTTAYLLWDAGCQGSCSFCPRGGGNREDERLSRVIWPEFAFDEVVRRLTAHQGVLRRICLQTGWNEQADALLPGLCRPLTKTGKPLCVTLHPQQNRLAADLLADGVDQIGLGVDVATRAGYETHKHRPWEEDQQRVESLLAAFPGRIEIHLIWGLGTTEEEFIRYTDRIISLGGKIALFALTATGKTGGNGLAPPSVAAYRRVQIFRHLREQGKLDLKACRFDAGQLAGFQDQQAVWILLQDGHAFRTSGCGDCNRPFYNETPKGPWYNFPRPLSGEETAVALLESGLFTPADFSKTPACR